MKEKILRILFKVTLLHILGFVAYGAFGHGSSAGLELGIASIVLGIMVINL